MVPESISTSMVSDPTITMNAHTLAESSNEIMQAIQMQIFH